MGEALPTSNMPRMLVYAIGVLSLVAVVLAIVQIA
jgi:hypothetical protein